MRLTKIEITTQAWEAMLGHVLACLPEEGCGLLAGEDGLASLAIPVENQWHSPKRFRMAPAAQVEAMLSVEARGLALMGIFHSHPEGPARPSAVDLAEAAYPELAYLIWSPSPEWTCQGFELSGGEVRHLRVDKRPRR